MREAGGMHRHRASGSGRDGISPAGPSAAIPRSKTAAGIKIWLGHCQISQLYPEIPACPRDASQERAGSVVPRLPADIGVGGGSPLGPVWDFHYWSCKPECWHRAVRVLRLAPKADVRGGPGGPHVSIPAGRLTARRLNGRRSLALPSRKGAITRCSGPTMAAALR